MNNLGEIIRKQRIAKGLSVEDLSERTMLSVAIINDIENGAFKLYEGDEMYVKMYLKKISRALDLDSVTLEASYAQVTEEIKQEELQRQLEEAEKKQENIQKRKDFKFERPNYNHGHTVYNNSKRNNYIKGIIIMVVIAVLVGFSYQLIGMAKNKGTYVADKETTTGKVTTNENSQKKKKTTKKKTKEETVKEELPQPVFNRLNLNRYQVSLPSESETFTFKAVFDHKTWVSFRINGQNTKLLESRLYSGKEDVAQATITVKEFQSLRIRNGSSKGTKYYVNDKEIPLTQQESSLTTSTFVLTKK